MVLECNSGFEKYIIINVIWADIDMKSNHQISFLKKLYVLVFYIKVAIFTDNYNSSTNMSIQVYQINWENSIEFELKVISVRWP